jgi:hypothetical protein
MYQIERDMEEIEKMEKREAYGIQLEDLLGFDRETAHGPLRY